MKVMEISNETSPTGKAKKLFPAFDHVSFCLSDLIFTLLEIAVISARRWITVENVGQAVIPALLSRGRLQEGQRKDGDGRDRQDNQKGKGGGRMRKKWSFPKPRDRSP